MNFQRTESKEHGRYVVYLLKDESMKPDFLIDDEVQVDTRIEVKNGDTVVAVLEDGRTILRQMVHKNGEYFFSPSNRAYDVIISKAPVIIGKAVRIYRKM